jgi:hypothetical protein
MKFSGWMLKEVPSKSEVNKDMMLRKQKIDEKYKAIPIIA